MLPLFLSYSQVSLFKRCPAAYRMIYHEHRKRRSSGAADFGIALHSLIAETYQRWRDEGRSGPVRAEMMTPDGLDRALAFRGVMGKDWMDKAERQLDNLCRMEGYKFDSEKMVGFEMEFLLRVKGLKKPFKGYIDRVHVDGSPGRTLVIVDYKTGRPPSDPELDGEWPDDAQGAKEQLSLYAIAAVLMVPRGSVEEVRIEVWYLEGPMRLKHTLTLEDLEQVEREWAKKGMKLARAKRWPYQLGEHCVWCDVRKVCPEYARTKP